MPPTASEKTYLAKYCQLHISTSTPLDEDEKKYLHIRESTHRDTVKPIQLECAGFELNKQAKAFHASRDHDGLGNVCSTVTNLGRKRKATDKATRCKLSVVVLYMGINTQIIVLSKRRVIEVSPEIDRSGGVWDREAGWAADGIAAAKGKPPIFQCVEGEAGSLQGV